MATTDSHVTSKFLVCAVCSQPVDLRTAKTDEDGAVVHEECYVLRVQNKRPSPDEASQ
jgi:hypothetical protein